MKKFLMTLLAAGICAAMFFQNPVFAADIVLDLQPEIEETAPDLEKWWPEYTQEIEEFDKKFPGSAIQEDFKDEVRQIHPEYSDAAVSYKETAIRWGVKLKRFYLSAYHKVTDFIQDKDLPLPLPDDQLATDAPEIYLPSDQPLVITDIKKAVTYSQNEQDRRFIPASEADRLNDPETLLQRQKMKDALLEGDWETLFSYGLFEGMNPAQEEGMGKWAGNDIFKARIYFNRTKIGDGTKVNAALHIYVKKGNFMLAGAFAEHPPLSLSFAASSNLQKIEANWPLPIRIVPKPDKPMVGYSGNIFVPLTIEAQDANQPLRLKARLKATLCGNNECLERKLAPQAVLEPGAGGESLAAGFLNIASLYVPQPSHSDLVLERLVAEPGKNPEDPGLLRAEFKTGESASGFEVFLNSPDGLQFAAPLIRIDGRKVVARFRALSAGDLEDKDFEIAARLRPDLSIRQTVRSQPASLFDTEGKTLSLGLLWLGFLGGLLLNLMPCVFPVLSLKILSLTAFGHGGGQRVRRGALFNFLGIVSAFVFLTAALLLLKSYGLAVGWGMQFQNVGFLTFIIFVVAAFLAHVWGLVTFQMPRSVTAAADNLSPFADLPDGSAAPRGENRLQFLTGLFLVLLATPCTAPYLGTALGFALAGNGWDIVLMMSAVAAGLSMPYLLLALIPELASALPKPGPWMQKINALMSLLLFLTLVWLISVMYAQTAGPVIFHFCLFLIGFWMVLWFRKLLLEVVDGLAETPDIILKVRRFFNVVFGLLVLILFTGALLDARYYYRLRRARVETSMASSMVTPEIINSYLHQNQSVLVRVGADWCLTCKFNSAMLFETENIRDFLENNQVKVIDIDWTRYNADVLRFMEKFGRRGLPFYVMFSPRVPDGMVLPEIMSEKEFTELVENLRY